MELQNATPLGDDARQLSMYLIDTYFKTQAYPFTKHHIDSYDQFLGKDLPALIRAANPILILKDKIPNTDEYRYKVEIFVGGEDGSAIEIGSPTIALQNTEEVRLLFPNEARLRNLTYSSLVMADIVCRISISTTDPKQPGFIDVQKHDRTFAKFPLFRIPIMLHSRYCNLHGKAAEFLEEAGECPQDYGGYFIVGGSEKVLITKQEQAFNTLYVNTQDHDKKISFFASISCLSPSTRQVKRISFYFMREFQLKRIIGDRPDRQYATLQVGLPYVRKPVPVFILFRALGYQTDKEIMRLILPDETSAETKLLEPYLIASMNEAFPFLDTYSAVQYIKSLTKGFSEAHVLDVLNNQFFIHIDVNQPGARAAFLGDCVRRILRVVAGLEPKTDKDDTRNQRLLVSGFSTQMLFSSIYDMWKKAVALSIDKQYNYNEKLYSGLNFLNIFSAGNTSLIFQPIMITEGIMRGFKGRWGSGLGEDKAGLIQQLSRLSYLDFLSHCRRVVLDFDTGMKLTGPRHLHPSQFGYFCTSEVPSGAAIGITKNLTILTSISTSSDPLPIAIFLYKRGWVLPCAAATDEQRAAYVPFFLNGGILGYCLEPVKVTRALSLMKRTACLPPYASVGFSMRDRRVFLYVDEGRPLRPLIYVNKQVFPLQKFKELKTWRELVCGSLREADTSSTLFFDPLADRVRATPDDYIAALESHCGAIEYVDPYEQNETLIATFPEYIIEETTHVEIHPSTILSVLTGVIPFPNHNQSPRNQLGDSQSKQGLSMYATNWQNRYDNMAHVLCYGEAPLVRTLYYDYIGGGKMSYGHNIILAIAAFTGYNQEDGIVMNHDSIQRGLFRSIAYKSYEAFEEDDPISKAKTRIGNPAKIASWTDMKPGVDYGKLDDSGIVKVGEYVDEHTVICGRYIQLPTGTMKDASVTGQVWTRGRVEKIAITVSPMGLRLIKIRVVQDRTPELGDKFSNRHGQKGTIGMLIRAHDMPRSASGIVPDFIMNPHAIPSRMTIGQLLENLFGKAAANVGAVGNGTPFMNQGSPHEEAGAALERLGFEKYGNEILYNGQTGEQIPSAIFMAPVFGMRLKHMTEDKWNARGEGRKEQLTHQPTGGRGNQGGLRIGEMERDAISGHGISAFVRESFMKRSDGTGFIICNSCGTIPIYNERQGLYICPLCDGPLQYAGENSRNLELIPPVKRTKASFSRIEEPYAMKVLGQELETYMNISMRYLTEGSLRTLRPIKGAPGEDVDITILQTALPTRIIPTMTEAPEPVVTTPAATTTTLPTLESVASSIGLTATAQTQAVATPVVVIKENPLENMSALPKIPQVFASIRPLQEVVETQPQQQEVALVEPQQFQQQPPTLTQGLIANQIGIAPSGQQVAYAIPTQAPPAQMLISPTAVTPVIMVDTTQPAMTAEGLSQQQPQLSQQTFRVKRPQVRFQEPAQQGGGESEGNSRGYTQQIQIMKLG
jgi:DNA-directed RNA polymerase II subunit RPB2